MIRTKPGIPIIYILLACEKQTFGGLKKESWDILTKFRTFKNSLNVITPVFDSLFVRLSPPRAKFYGDEFKFGIYK